MCTRNIVVVVEMVLMVLGSTPRHKWCLLRGEIPGFLGGEVSLQQDTLDTLEGLLYLRSQDCCAVARRVLLLHVGVVTLLFLALLLFLVLLLFALFLLF